MKVTYEMEEVKLNKNMIGTIEEKIADRITIAANVAQDLSQFRQETRSIVKEAMSQKKVNVAKVEKILAAVGWAKQDISKEMLAYGLRRREASKAKLALSKKLQDIAQSEFATLQKKYSAKEIAAIGRRLQLLAQQSAK